jgi:hypothetical protein
MGLAGHDLAEVHERTSIIVATSLAFCEWADVFGDTKVATALFGWDRCK